ncbi:MAG TPA: molybdenum cofactor guanylyltransferase [Bryobacteraceae bacterium]|nr:molybdenum cofactor guanylyltransferase [Bryobacteraceae bacterium]
MAGLADVSGYVLVGGRSSRMGTDKALIIYHGQTLAGHIASELSTIAGTVSLVGDPGRYAGLGYTVVRDEYPGAGPTGGLVTALRASRTRWNLVAACDLPEVSAAFFGLLLNRIRSLDVRAVIPVTPDGRRQVLCAAYRSDACAVLGRAFESGETKLQAAISQLDADYWRIESDKLSVNLNTPEDWNVFMRQEA